MIQYLLSGFELELYSMHEYYYIYWWEQTHLVSLLVGTHYQIPLHLQFGFTCELMCLFSWLQVPVRVPVRMADVHSEPSRLLSDGRGEDSWGAAERTQQQKDQEEEKR